MTVPLVKLADKTSIPAVGFGVGTKWGGGKAASEAVVAALVSAIKQGFRHIDGAQAYGTEAEVAAAIKESGIPRSEFYITTKAMDLTDPVKQLDESLKLLNTDHVDLYLLHQPFLDKVPGQTLANLWKGLESLVAAGKTKSIGVSNFAVEHLEEILKVATIKPVVNQIEYSPYLQNQTPGIVEFAKKHGIQIVAYGPLAPVLPKHADGPLPAKLEALSAKYGKTPAQIVLRWVYQTGVVAVTTSQSATRQKQALEIFDFELSPEDVKLISDVGATFPVRQFWNVRFD